MSELNESTPWYRLPIVWLVAGIPLCTVLGCLLTIYLAISNPDRHVAGPGANVTQEAARD